MLRLLACSVLGLSLVACTDVVGDGSTEGAAPAADPPTGAWFYAHGANISDTCNIPGWMVDESTEFGLTNNGDGTFTVLREGQNIECSIAGDNFTCAPIALDPISNEMFDATFNLDVSYAGTFSGDTALDGERTIDVSCTGAQCDALATALMTAFPCAVVDAFTATLS